ncbi:PapB/FocB family fimbrial expression transcriptional regulator [Moritella sp.]|uniref:PapB/FocB family fimbrial expression transcriptional regulator n=1 Tax=Moritella sp. TaxID=78556 RepID=UPI0025FFDB4F|nr:PapB/FocB family fimbrial expression transcriptional regulator [Moritella sp.]MCJ8351161.1 adhesin biosynthesis transcription regulatory family protein [Moritella sp.]
MRVLIQGLEPKERVKLLFKLTRIDSENIQSALIDHLCKGHKEDDAAMLNDVPRQNFNRALKRLNDVAEVVEKIKEID